MIVRTDVLTHLERGMRAGFLTAQKAYTPRRAAFTREATSDGAFEIYGDMGAVPWPRQAGGQAAGSGTDERTDKPQIGGLHEGGPIVVIGGNDRGVVVYNQDWNVPIGIYHNAINDNRVGGLEEWARNAGARFEQHMDYLCFSALNDGEGTTWGRCYDGLSLFNNSHVDPGAEYQTTQDNRYAVALSLDNFETVRVAAGGFLDDRGVPMGLEYDLLIHSLNLARTAAQITDNREDYGTGNRAMNPYVGSVRRLEAPGGWLDSTAWMLAASQAPPVILQVRERPQLVFWDEYTQTASGIRYYSWTARYAIAYGDWRGVIMGNT
jgi:hypothetical protein